MAQVGCFSGSRLDCGSEVDIVHEVRSRWGVVVAKLAESAGSKDLRCSAPTRY
jgi:hypothetical protein